MPENPAGPPPTPASTSTPSGPSGRFDSINIGDMIADKYRVVEVIGRGGMGVVLAAEHVQLQERVALKFLKLDTETPKEFQQRFVREAQVTARLRSEHVARIRDFGVLPEGTPYMVMELLEGIDLRKAVRQLGRLPLDKTLDYVVQACEGLAEAHAAGIVHRDLKPSNLFLTRRSDGSDLIKILDFGVAKMVQDVDRDELTSAGMLLGSPRYMSPQQLRGSHDVDARADIWSLGAIMYEMLAGRAPFLAQTTAALCVKILGNEPPASISAQHSDVPPEIEAVILACLERELDKRIPDVATLAKRLAKVAKLPWLDEAALRVGAVLERSTMLQTGSHSTASSKLPRPPALAPLLMEGEQISTMPSSIAELDASSPSPATSRAPPRKRTVALIAAVAAVLVAGAGAFFAVQHSSEQAPAIPPSTSAPALLAPSSPQQSVSAAVVPTPSVASATPPAASVPRESAPGKRNTGGAWPVKAKTPPPATQTAPPATTRPAVNPLDDRQ
jgi:eukaryotic-like serine/threonine-protein kinase